MTPHEAERAFGLALVLGALLVLSVVAACCAWDEWREHRAEVRWLEQWAREQGSEP